MGYLREDCSDAGQYVCDIISMSIASIRNIGILGDKFNPCPNQI